MPGQCLVKKDSRQPKSISEAPNRRSGRKAELSYSVTASRQEEEKEEKYNFIFRLGG